MIWFKTKKEALANKPSDSILVAKDVSSKGHKNFSFITERSEYNDLIQNDSEKHLYECINTDDNVKIFFDIDIPKKTDKEEKNNIINKILTTLNDVLIRVFNISFLEEDVVILNASDDTKTSLHIIINNEKYFKQITELKSFIKMNFDPTFVKQYGIDVCVYKPGMFRLPYCSKKGQQRPLEIITNHTIEDCLVTNKNIQECDLLHYKKKQEPTTTPTNDKEYIFNTNTQLIEYVFGELPDEFWDEYDNYITTGMIAKNQGGLKDLWIHHCKKSEKFSHKDAEYKWSSFRTDVERKIGIPRLLEYFKTHCPGKNIPSVLFQMKEDFINKHNRAYEYYKNKFGYHLIKENDSTAYFEDDITINKKTGYVYKKKTMIDNIFFHKTREQINFDETIQTLREYRQKKKYELIQSTYGTGKTHFIIRQKLKEAIDKNKSVLILTENRALAKAYKSNFPQLQHYLDDFDKRQTIRADYVICQLESIPRLVRNYDHIYIDELSSILKHFHSSTVRNRSKTIDLFVEKLRQARIVLGLDANITPSVKKLMSLILETDDIRCIHCTDKPFKDYKIVLTPYTEESKNKHIQAFETIDTKLEQGLKIAVHSQSLKNAKELYHYLRVKKRNVLLVSSEGACDDELYADQELKQETLEDINEIVTSYDCFIFTPSIKTGVSFNEDYFHELYVFVERKCTCPRELSQGAFRIRSLKHKKIYFCYCGTNINYIRREEDDNQIIERLLFNEEYARTRNEYAVVYDYKKKAVKDNVSFQLLVLNEKEDIERDCNLLPNTIMYLLETGMTIDYQTTDELWKDKQKKFPEEQSNKRQFVSDLVDDETDHNFQLIKDEDDITEEVYHQLKDKTDITDKEYRMRVKYFLQQFCKTKDLSKFPPDILKKQIRDIIENNQLFKLSIDELTEEQTMDTPSDDRIEAFYQDTTFSHIPKNKKRRIKYCKILYKLLRFKTDRDFVYKKKMDTPELYEFLTLNYDKLVKIFNSRSRGNVSTFKGALAFINNILQNELGFQIKLFERKKHNSDYDTYWVLKQTKIASILSLFNEH